MRASERWEVALHESAGAPGARRRRNRIRPVTNSSAAAPCRAGAVPCRRGNGHGRIGAFPQTPEPYGLAKNGASAGQAATCGPMAAGWSCRACNRANCDRSAARLASGRDNIGLTRIVFVHNFKNCIVSQTNKRPHPVRRVVVEYIRVVWARMLWIAHCSASARGMIKIHNRERRNLWRLLQENRSAWTK